MRVVILTKSFKHGGYCVAGLDAETGGWVRLCSEDEASHGALTEQHMRYGLLTRCRILDVAEVAVKVAAPTRLQPENVVIDTGAKWKKAGRMTLRQVLGLHPAEREEVLLGNKLPYLHEREAEGVGRSLTLVRVEGLRIYAAEQKNEKRKTKAAFTYAGQAYRDMAVTDPVYVPLRETREYPEAVLAVSTPDVPYNGKYYKYVAQVFPVTD